MIKDIPETKKQVCIRFRNSNLNCNLCSEVCKTNAINFTNSQIIINPELCTNCMLCVSHCPTGAIDSQCYDFIYEIQDLPSSDSLILGCIHKTEQKAHVRSRCFGFFNEDYLLSLIQHNQYHNYIFNLSSCQDCIKNNILTEFKELIIRFNERLSYDKYIIDFIEEQDQIDFELLEYNRRSFFSSIINISKRKFQSLEGFGMNEEIFLQGKYLPSSRLLLNKLLKSEESKSTWDNYSSFQFEFLLDETCDFCQLCIGMCPTGAIKKDSSSGEKKLIFETTLCTDCKICQNSCPQKSITIKRKKRREGLNE